MKTNKRSHNNIETGQLINRSEIAAVKAAPIVFQCVNKHWIKTVRSVFIKSSNAGAHSKT